MLRLAEKGIPWTNRKRNRTQKKKRSALPIYAIGIVWLLYAGKLNTFRGILSCAVVSAIVYAILRIVLPGKKTDEPPKAAAPEQPQPKQAEKKPEPQPEPEPEEKLPPELQSVIYQGKRAIADIRRLNDEIPDERISAQIDLIERLTAQIFDCVRKNPKKLSQIRQFLNYYLPTTIKLMEQYVTLQNQSLKTENITEGMQKIEDLLDKVIIAFQRQLDALFEADVVDITADIRVMEQMMASEGLTNKKDFA
ncbi:MAG: 5-bromo-4-chloroindolyl phosphate hydrolysis family protein [Oscillospiraceae bacterium]